MWKGKPDSQHRNGKHAHSLNVNKTSMCKMGIDQNSSWLLCWIYWSLCKGAGLGQILFHVVPDLCDFLSTLIQRMSLFVIQSITDWMYLTFIAWTFLCVLFNRYYIRFNLPVIIIIWNYWFVIIFSTTY